ncbi:MAG: hypothetical protein PVG39_03700 [Desulfobacteraceae bacterium]|jgi:hypothetical protein
MMKRFIIMILCLLMFSQGYAADSSVFGKIGGLLKKTTDTKQKEKNSYSDVAAKDDCSRSTAEVDSLNPIEYGKALVMKKGIKRFVKNLGLEEVEIELPEKIMNRCEAEKRLTYIRRTTDHWTGSVVQALAIAAEALEIDKEVEATRLIADGKMFKDLTESDIVSIRRDLDKDMEKILKAIEEKEQINQELLISAEAELHAAEIRGGLIVGWDQRMADFMGENMNWAFKRLMGGDLNHFKEQFRLATDTLKGIYKVSKASSAIKKTGVDDDEYQRIVAQRKKENAAYEAQVTKDLQL